MKLNLLLTAVCVFVANAIMSQCNVAAVINQLPVTCSDNQITFMGYATSDCPVNGAFNYTWLAYVDGGSGNQVAIDELTISGSAISGTTFPQFTLQLGAFPYVQVCLMVNYLDGDGLPQGETFVCQSAINFPQPLVVTAFVGSNSCGQASCIAQFMANGGTAPYTYLLSNGQILNPSVWNCFEEPGTYVLTAIDANGCEGNTSFTINVASTENGTCDQAIAMENGVVLNDTICSINQEPAACGNGINYIQYGWYSFNSENFTHANIAFNSGYGSNQGGSIAFTYPSLVEIYQSPADGSCAGAELVFCHAAGGSSATGSSDPMCFDLADSLVLQPNTTYYIKYMTQWTSWVPLQGLVTLTNEPIAPICGCTDNTSCNYDPDALISDGSCGWSGCMDQGACNYQNWVTCDNGSCIYGSDINGFIFHDVNGDGIQQTWQPAEPVLSNIGVITIEELGVLIYPDANGHFTLPNIPQATYSISFEDPNGYWVLNAEGAIQVTLPTCNGLKLPLIPASEATAQISGLSTWENTTIHCAVGFNPGIYLYNNGNLPFSGTFTMSFDPALTYTEAPWAGTGVTVESPIQTAPGELTWTIDNQPAGSLYYYQIHINGPGAATTGQSFPFAFSLTLNDVNGAVFYNQDWNINPTVTCSYDPNDKQATPAGWTEQHFITAGEELEYRIRFQNTGNAPAFNVRIDDQIDITRLNLNSFTPIAASHSYSTIVTPDGMVQFVFDNILLPDSVHDEPNSHGWVVYRIRSFDELQPLDVINNTAAIYFDDNEPVITNTYSHTIFSCDMIPDPNGVSGTCEGQEVLLNIFPEMDYTEAYTWYVDGNLVSNEMMYNFPASNQGDYSFVLNRTNPFCSVFDTLEVQVWPLPQGAIIDGGPALAAPAGVSWQWYLNGEEIDETSQVITPVVNGFYSVLTTNEFGCTALSDAIEYIAENVKESSVSSIDLFPNPAYDAVRITLPMGEAGLKIYNGLGQMVYQDAQARGTLTLNVQSWNPGLYMVQSANTGFVKLIVR
jgi:uncharacterized repeat protein (TIGR01451 family)